MPQRLIMLSFARSVARGVRLAKERLRVKIGVVGSCVVLLAVVASASCSFLPSDKTRVYCSVLSDGRQTSDNNKENVLIVFADQTVALEKTGSAAFAPSCFSEEGLRTTFPSASAQTIRDFVVQNRSVSGISRIPDCPVRYVVENAAVVDRLLRSDSQKEYLDYFAKRSKFPTMAAFVRFSNVGFNQQKTEALVYAESRSGPLSAVGGVLLLRKTDGTWKVIESGDGWRS
jgi:hypothetical protein